ncbi:Glutaminase [Serinicoccus hydrothermalis]|uniref:Glutaminase n=1 Tax=Serinicoccus hydrothermalis TaxID=1758689 RepID=A0A1B1NDA6_9MICO|nr:glutaminase A [Serinicoccus hydrothermalis]ANS79419.1 Glutaminase [Serinicoccus hydrothermalis]
MRNPVQEYLEQIVAQGGDAGGEVAPYIPELAAADPDRFALCLATVDGQVYEVGESEHRYSIQSMSKPFTYALGLHDQGIEAVARKVDVEPSGEAFNEISVSPDTGRPKNPMINAGAITASSLVAGDSGDERFARALEWYSRFAGRELELDPSIYTSELETAHRNRAIAHMLREFGILDGDPEEVLDQYIRQCSVAVDTRDLALMAATLANGGVQPRTGEQVLEPALVEHVLSVMTTCGMYDAAGDWVTAVGIPAKSGVSGGIIGVLPGQVGIAVFSPRLDPHGNSARGVALLERMSTDMELHLMHVSRGSRSALRSSYSLETARSTTRWQGADQEVLERVSDRARVYEMQGDILFAGAESVARQVVQDAPELAIFDLTHVNEIAQVSRLTLLSLRDRLREQGAEAIAVDPDGVFPDPRAGTDEASPIFTDLTSAIEWCERMLIRTHCGPRPEPDPVEDHPLVRDLEGASLEAVRSAMTRRSVPAGEVVLEAGGDFAGIHLIVSGRAVAQDDAPGGGTMTLVTMGPGTSFGELALGTDGVQETRVVAVDDLELLVLSAADLQRITEEDPAVALPIWRAIAEDGYRVADRALRRSAVRA